ncbi:MAG TPA: beta-propeller fold lactonase family protein, partial [Actinomycetota bacterium]
MTEPGGRHLAYRQILAPTLVALGLLAAPPSATAAHLTFLGAVFDGVAGADGLEHAQDLVVSPDGLHVYVVAEEEHAVALYARDASSGALGFVQKWVDGVDGVDGIENPIGVAVSPDGAHVYATGSFDNGLAAFARDAGTGLLTFVEAKHNDVGGVIGLDNPGDVTLSPDGEHVYVTTWDDWGVVVFARDPATGVLTFVEAEFDGGGATGLINATTVELSPDGKHVYVASEGSDAVAVFARDAGSGELTFVEAEFDGMGGVDGLDGAVSVVVSPDGDHVYVGSLEDDAIATFARNATTGALTFVDATFDNTGDIDGLDRPLALATSAD